MTTARQDGARCGFRRGFAVAALACLGGMVVACDKPAAEDRQQGASSASSRSSSVLPMATSAEMSRDPAARLLTAQIAPRQKGPFAPQDQCRAIEGADAFRMALARAVVARDVAGFARLVDPRVRLGFAGDDGADRLRQRLEADDGALFGELAKVLALGCAPGPGPGSSEAMTMPWFFAQDAKIDDPFSALLIVGENVSVRTRPQRDAASIAQVSWDLVTLGSEDRATGPYRKVDLGEGRTGYVAREATRSLLDYRVLANRIDGQWRVTAIVAGD